MPAPYRSSPSALIGTFGLLLLVAFPLAAQEKTAAQLRGEAFLAELPENLATLFQTKVMPKLLQAESNDQVFDEAVNLFTAWVRQHEMNGIEIDHSSMERALVALGKAYRTAILGSGKHCFERKDPSEVVIMQGLLRTAEAQGLQTDLTTETLEELISKCMRFELVFASDIRLVSQGGTQRSVVKATVPLVLDPKPDEGTLPLLRGSGPIDYVSFELQMPPLPVRCQVTTSTQSAEATVHRLQYKIERDSVDKRLKYSEIELWLHPGEPTETINLCGSNDTRSRWFTFFKILHLAEQTPEPDKAYFIFKDWKVSGAGEVFARKEVREPSASAAPAGPLLGMLDGEMRLELRHKPVWP